MSDSVSRENDFKDVPRDRVTGVPASRSMRGRITDGADSDHIEQEIRRTRAQMSDTLDQIEDRLSPARMKRELKHTIDETIADVRDEYNPKRMAKQAGDTMLETIKDHPFAAMAAGLSVGYLAIKGAEESREGGSYDRSYDRTRRRRATYNEYEGYSPVSPGGPQYAEFSVPSSERVSHQRFDDVPEYERDPAGDIRHRADDMRGRMREGAEAARDRAEHLAHESAHSVRDFKDATVERSRDVARRAQRGARSAGSQLEDFLYENPLAAGAIAVGVGAIVGGLFPSTHVEDRYMGPTRDQAMDRARRVADETLEHGKEAAGRVADEAKHAARDVAEKGKEEARNVGETAQRSATEESPTGHGTAQRGREEGRLEQGAAQRSAMEGSRGAHGTAARGGTDQDRAEQGTAPRGGTDQGRAEQGAAPRGGTDQGRAEQRTAPRSGTDEGRGEQRTPQRGATEATRDTEDRPFGSSVK